MHSCVMCMRTWGRITRTTIPHQTHPSVLVRMHTQLFSMARTACSRPTATWPKREGGDSSTATWPKREGEDSAPLDFARDMMAEDDASASGEAAGGSGSQWTWAQKNAQTNLPTKVHGLKPCSRCKSQRKGVSYCIRLGHVPVAMSSQRTAAGGTTPGVRALLVISRIMDRDAEERSQEHLRENLWMNMQLFSGIFQIEPCCLSGDGVTPGKIREVQTPD